MSALSGGGAKALYSYKDVGAVGDAARAPSLLNAALCSVSLILRKGIGLASQSQQHNQQNVEKKFREKKRKFTYLPSKPISASFASAAAVRHSKARALARPIYASAGLMKLN